MSLALFIQQDIEDYSKILSSLEKNTKVIQKILQNDVTVANPLVVDKQLVSYYQLLLKNGSYLLDQTKLLQDLISKLQTYFKQLLSANPSVNGKKLAEINIDTSLAKDYEQKIENELKSYFEAMNQIVELEGSFLKEESYVLSYVEAYNSLSKEISSTKYISKSQPFQKSTPAIIVQIVQQELQNSKPSFSNLSKFCQLMEWSIKNFYSEIDPEPKQQEFLKAIPKMLYSNISQLKDEEREFFVSTVSRNLIDGFKIQKDDGDNLNNLIKCFSKDIREKEAIDTKTKIFEKELKEFTKKYSVFKGTQNFNIDYNLGEILKSTEKYTLGQRLLILKYLTTFFDSLIKIAKNNNDEIQFTSIKTNQLGLFIIDHFSKLSPDDWFEKNMVDRGEADATFYVKQFFKSEIAKTQQSVFPQ